MSKNLGFDEELIAKYKLEENEHKIVLEKLKNTIFENRSLSKKSSVMFVIGQPGCGKTTFIQNSKFDDYIIINSDDYRKFHKYSPEILVKYPVYYAKLTNYDAHLWGDELFDYGIQNGYNVLREKALTDLSLLKLLKTISDSHEVEINVVVSGNLASLIATRERYEKELLSKANAKLSNIEAHNKCYNVLSEFISKCLSLNIKVNYVVFDKKQYKVIPVKDDYLDLLQKYRDESNNLACHNFETRMNNLKKSMTKRNAPKEEFEELEKIENLYKEIVKENLYVRK